MVGYNPGTLKEALRILNEAEEATIFSGGTDLMVQKNFRKDIVFIEQIQELKRVEHDASCWYIGACCTFSQLIGSELPDILKTVFCQIASPAIRNMGTVGGNICNASPAGDSLPMLYAMHAEVELSLIDGDGTIQERIIPISHFIKGVRRKDLRSNEILTRIMIPVKYCNDKLYYYYKKVGARRSEAISKLSFFGLADTKDGTINEVSIAFGAVGTTVVQRNELEERLSGISKAALRDIIQELSDAYMEWVKPIDDQRSTALYRKKTAENLLKDFLEQLVLES